MSQKCLRHLDRVGHAAGLDDHVFRRVVALNQAKHGVEQVIADGAADATIAQVDCLALHADDQLGVDVDRAEVIDQHRDLEAVPAIEDAVEQGGLAGAQKAGDDGDRQRRD